MTSDFPFSLRLALLWMLCACSSDADLRDAPSDGGSPIQWCWRSAGQLICPCTRHPPSTLEEAVQDRESSLGLGKCDSNQWCLPDPDSPNDQDGICGCDETLCTDRRECVQGYCVQPNACGFTPAVPCLDGGICDPRADRCFPSNGDCSGDRGCPSFLGLDPSAQVQCVAGHCRVLRTPNAPWLEMERDSLGWQSPRTSPPTEFPRWEEVLFDWEDSDHPVLVTILRAFPDNKEQFQEQALWTASVPPSAPSSIHFVDGHVRPENAEGSPWQAAPAALAACPESTHFPCDGGVFYVVVLAVRPNGLQQVSPIVPFAVGQAQWPHELSPCQNESDCAHPSEVYSCYSGQCRIACASNLDCPASRRSRCGRLVDGRRMCDVQL